MNIKSLLNVAGLLLATLLVFYLLLFNVNFGVNATFNPGVCPDSGGWVKVDGLSGFHYEFNVPSGYTVSDNCYKAGDFVVYGTGSNVISGVFNSPQGAVCTAPGIPHNGCNYLDLSHASFLLVELSTPPDDPPVCEWTQWSECSAPCGGGIHDRYCGDQREWEACNTQACPCPEVPEFPQCPLGYNGNPHYDRYASNPHQIVGGPLLFGGDDVYSLENGNYLQCFCPDEGTDGIQTNWWRTDEILDGWFREFGTQWNLGDNWYLAQNSSFICDSGNTGGNDPTSTPTPTPSPTPTSSQSSGGSTSSGSSSSNTSDNNQAQVLGASTLADTGSVSDSFIMLGLILTLSSLYGASKQIVKKEN